jgi:hypothetical protein
MAPVMAALVIGAARASSGVNFAFIRYKQLKNSIHKT